MPQPTAPSATTGPVAFGASWNRSTRWLTVGFLLSCAAILAVTYSGARQPVVFYLTSGLLSAAIAMAFGLSPVGYQVGESSIVIRRRLGRKAIPMASVRAARLMEPAELAESMWRWPAVGGLFGFYGTFETPALGRHRWYASRDRDLVLLQTVEGPVVVSPDDPEGFVREVNQRLRAKNRI
jgi:hypothetical protein